MKSKKEFVESIMSFEPEHFTTEALDIMYKLILKKWDSYDDTYQNTLIWMPSYICNDYHEYKCIEEFAEKNGMTSEMAKEDYLVIPIEGTTRVIVLY